MVEISCKNNVKWKNESSIKFCIVKKCKIKPLEWWLARLFMRGADVGKRGMDRKIKVNAEVLFIQILCGIIMLYWKNLKSELGEKFYEN